eukprot:GEMP01011682.1.p1 GENE.GEMP01011682.1~~GEMP01011682.1.p1  ORF type:complete len:249 (+),score=44.31 GEMP01011682.1:47-748(+)
MSAIDYLCALFALSCVGVTVTGWIIDQWCMKYTEVTIPCMFGLYYEGSEKLEKVETDGTYYFWSLNRWCIRSLVLSMIMCSLATAVLFTGASDPVEGKKRSAVRPPSRIPTLCCLVASLSAFACLAQARYFFAPRQFDEWGVSYYMNLATAVTALVLTLPLSYRRWRHRGIGNNGETTKILKAQMPRVRYEQWDDDVFSEFGHAGNGDAEEVGISSWTTNLKATITNLSSSVF